MLTSESEKPNSANTGGAAEADNRNAAVTIVDGPSPIVKISPSN